MDTARGNFTLVIRINLPFVKMHLGIIQGRNTITGQDNFPLGFESCIHKKGLQNAAKQEYQDKRGIGDITGLSVGKLWEMLDGINKTIRGFVSLASYVWCL